MNKIYYLAHLTTEENGRKILESKKFNFSIHTQSSNQWLGDGVYFWDINDDEAIKLGKRLVQNKFINRRKKIVLITVQITVNQEKYADLDTILWSEKLIKFIKKNKEFNDGQKIIDLMELCSEKNSLTNSEKNEIGFLLGNAINLFVKILKESYNIQIDLISYSFFDKKVQKNILRNSEIRYKQYCCKSEQIVGNIDDNNFRIEYI